MKLWQALELVREQPHDPSCGICYNVELVLDSSEVNGSCIYEMINDAAPNWTGCSKDQYYPVGGKDEFYNGRTVRMLQPKRQEFLNWLIDYFKQLDI